MLTNGSRTYDPLVTCPDALPLSYRRLVGAKATKLGLVYTFRTWMSTGAYTQCQLFQYFVENTVLCAIFSPRKTFSFNSGVRQRILQVHVTMHKVPHC